MNAPIRMVPKTSVNWTTDCQLTCQINIPLPRSIPPIISTNNFVLPNKTSLLSLKLPAQTTRRHSPPSDPYTIRSTQRQRSTALFVNHQISNHTTNVYRCSDHRRQLTCQINSPSPRSIPPIISTNKSSLPNSHRCCRSNFRHRQHAATHLRLTRILFAPLSVSVPLPLFVNADPAITPLNVISVFRPPAVSRDVPIG